MAKKQLNAIVNCEKKGKYFNLYVEIPNGDEPIKVKVKPITKDNRTLVKLLFKIYSSLGE